DTLNLVPAPGNGLTAFLNLSGTMLFSSNRIHVFVDADDDLAETDEQNNIRSSADGCVTDCADLTPSWLRVDRSAMPGSVGLTARLGNGGSASVPAGVTLAFYRDDPGIPGNLIGVAVSSSGLAPGAFEDLSVTWTAPPVAVVDIYVVADQPNAVAELDETNNRFRRTENLEPNLAPVADAGSDRVVFINQFVGLNGLGSSDGDLDPISYAWEVVSLPVGSEAVLIDPDSAEPRFPADVPGEYVFELVVSDGREFSLPARVAITARDPAENLVPLIVSTPPLEGMVTVPWSYDVVGVDPNPADNPVSYELALAPDGMTMTPGGALSWTPTEAGRYQVEVKAVDPLGAFFLQGFFITVIDYSNTPPAIVSEPIVRAEPNGLYTYPVVAVDANGDTLTWSLTQAPAGMTIDPSDGTITWTPGHGDIGAHTIEVAVQEGAPDFQSDFQPFELVVLVDSPFAPFVSPIPDQTVIGNQPFIVEFLDDYVNDPNYTPQQMTWTAEGNNLLNVSINASRIASITYAPGVRVQENITFIATNPDGFSGSATARFTVRDPDNPPDAAIANLPLEETTNIEEGFFELFGTADDPDEVDDVSYKVSLHHPDGYFVADVTPKPVNAEGFHEGRVAAGGSLGEIDFTLVRNGVYDLVLDVKGGTQIATEYARIALNSQLKIGNFSFSQQDVVIPVSGIPLTVVRTYNTLNPNDGAFGHSWSYAINDLEFEIDETRVDTEDIFGNTFSMRVGGGWNITLTMPDTGRRVTFVQEFEQRANGLRLLWNAPAGVHASLRATRLTTVNFTLGGMPVWLDGGAGTPFQSYDFPGFILTTKDGTAYHIDRKNEGGHHVLSETGIQSSVRAWSGGYVSRITTRNGDRLEIERNEAGIDTIDHYDPFG
ncbi:MAG: putative Ig domain-containing protein, partial [Verrucomicrobiota bacterium]